MTHADRNLELIYFTSVIYFFIFLFFFTSLSTKVEKQSKLDHNQLEQDQLPLLKFFS